MPVGYWRGSSFALTVRPVVVRTFYHGLTVDERAPPPVLGDVTEQPVLDLGPPGRSRWEVRGADGEPAAVGETLPLEQGRARFARKALAALGALAQRRQQKRERHLRVELAVTRGKDDPHAAPAEPLRDLVLAEDDVADREVANAAAPLAFRCQPLPARARRRTRGLPSIKPPTLRR